MLAVLLAAVSVCGSAPVFAQQKKGAPANATDPIDLIAGVGGIEWIWSPRETLATLLSKGGPQPVVVWVGRIIDVRAKQAVTGGDESAVEFLAAYMPLMKPGPGALAVPLRVRPETGDHFVVSLRSGPVSDEMVKNLRQSMLDTTHYTVVLGEPRFIAPYGRQAAIFLQTRRAIVSQQLKIDIVRE